MCRHFLLNEDTLRCIINLEYLYLNSFPSVFLFCCMTHQGKCFSRFVSTLDTPIFTLITNGDHPL